MTLGAITLKDIKFGLAETVSDDFVSFPIDGILGLGFPAASAQKVPIFLENLVCELAYTCPIYRLVVSAGPFRPKTYAFVCTDLAEYCNQADVWCLSAP